MGNELPPLSHPASPGTDEPDEGRVRMGTFQFKIQPYGQYVKRADSLDFNPKLRESPPGGSAASFVLAAAQVSVEDVVLP